MVLEGSRDKDKGVLLTTQQNSEKTGSEKECYSPEALVYFKR